MVVNVWPAARVTVTMVGISRGRRDQGIKWQQSGLAALTDVFERTASHQGQERSWLE